MAEDIHRVRLGMTRADIEWLFVPYDGFKMNGYGFAETYVYRCGHSSSASVGTNGRPVLDPATGRPLVFGGPICIDVRFRPASVERLSLEDGTNHRFLAPDGQPADVIVSVSAPYAR